MNPEDLRYRLRVITPNPKADLYLDDIILSFNMEESDDLWARRLTASVENVKHRDKRIAQLLMNGARVKAYAGTGRHVEERFRGNVFENRTSKRAGQYVHEIVAYDDLYYLLQSEDDRYYKEGRTGKQIITDIAKGWGIRTGRIDGPNVPLASKKFRQKTLAQMITRVLRESRQKGAARFICRMDDQGRLEVVKRGGNKDVWVFEQENIGGTDVTRSIATIVTKVKVVGRSKGGSKTLAVAKSEFIDDFGTIQRIVVRNDYNNPAAAAKAAKGILKNEGEEQKTRMIESVDVPSLRRGDRCRIKAATLHGDYIVRSIARDAPNKRMMVEVETLQEEEIEIDFKEMGLDTWDPPGNEPGSTNNKVSDYGYIWPADGPVTSGFGAARDGGTRKHLGIDIGAAHGSTIKAAKKGRVSVAGELSGYGKVVYVDHPLGWSSRYAHLGSISVSVGDEVDQGDKLGTCDNTGVSTGTHLHFEVRQGGSPIDPMKVLP